MSGNPGDASAALARAAQQIAELQSQLAAATSTVVTLQRQNSQIQNQLTARQAENATLKTNLNAATGRAQELQAAIDAINAPVEPGVSRGPQPFVTSDGTIFPTLHEARVHNARLKFGVNAKTAGLILAQGI